MIAKALRFVDGGLRVNSSGYNGEERPNPAKADQPICSGYHEARHANLGSHEGSWRIRGRNGTNIAFFFVKDIVCQQAHCGVSTMKCRSVTLCALIERCHSNPTTGCSACKTNDSVLVANVGPVPSSPSLPRLDLYPGLSKQPGPSMYVRTTVCLHSSGRPKARKGASTTAM